MSASAIAALMDCSTSTTAVPCLPQLVQQLEDRGERLGRQPERELVDQQHARLAQQRLGDGEHLLLSTGEVAGRQVEPLLEGREPAAGVRDPVCVSPGDHQVLADAQRRQHRRPARHERDPEAAPAGEGTSS